MPPPPPSPIFPFQRQIPEPLFAVFEFSYISVNNLFYAFLDFSLFFLYGLPSRTRDSNIIRDNIHFSTHMHPHPFMVVCSTRPLLLGCYTNNS